MQPWMVIKKNGMPQHTIRPQNTNVFQYFSMLFKIMSELGTHEGCIEQTCRLFSDRLYGGSDEVAVDEGDGTDLPNQRF